MCRIFALATNNTISNDAIAGFFMQMKAGGPNASDLQSFNFTDSNGKHTVYIGMHRLSINDVSDKGMQPFIYNDENEYTAIVCNGQIYNSKSLHEQLEKILKKSIKLESTSDCEILLHLYRHYGSKKLSDILDGFFAFIVASFNKNTGELKVECSRDMAGVRSLYHSYSVIPGKSGNLSYSFAVASELRSLVRMVPSSNPVIPGSIYKFNYSNQNPKFETEKWYDYTFPKNIFQKKKDSGAATSTSGGLVEKEIEFPGYVLPEHWSKFSTIKPSDLVELHKFVREALIQNVREAYTQVDPKIRRNIVFPLSGGLDSSLIVGIAAKIQKEIDSKQKIKTIAVGMEGSSDIEYAKKVQTHCDTDHIEYNFDKDLVKQIIPKIINVCETYDITTIRASIGQYLACSVAKQKHCNNGTVVIITGEGPDEMGGYRLFHSINNHSEALTKKISLIKEMYLFDCLRLDKSAGATGEEARPEYLRRKWIELMLSLPPELTDPEILKDGTKMEKPLLRHAFKNENIIPLENLFRGKVTFSDGSASDKKPLKDIIGKFVESRISDDEYKERSRYHSYHFVPPTKEAYYYQSIFLSMYGPQHLSVLPHYWNNMVEPSAQTTKNYVGNRQVYKITDEK